MLRHSARYAPSVTPVSASAGLTAWGSGVSSITGTPSAWAADTITRAEIYGITMLSDGSYQSPITRRTLARLAANTARTLGLVEDVSDPIAVVQQLGVMQPNADGSFDQTSKVTRQMAATVLLRLLRQSSTVFDADYSTLSRYPDSAALLRPQPQRQTHQVLSLAGVQSQIAGLRPPCNRLLLHRAAAL